MKIYYYKFIIIFNIKLFDFHCFFFLNLILVILKLHLVISEIV